MPIKRTVIDDQMVHGKRQLIVRYTMPKGQIIKQGDIKKDIFDKINDSYHLQIRGMTPLGVRTFTKDGKWAFQDFDTYMRGRVKNTSKFVDKIGVVEVLARER